MTDQDKLAADLSALWATNRDRIAAEIEAAHKAMWVDDSLLYRPLKEAPADE